MLCLIKEITARATDPQRQVSFLDVPRTVNYTDSLHSVILQQMREKFSRPGEVADIKKIEKGPQDVKMQLIQNYQFIQFFQFIDQLLIYIIKLKIIGFKHRDIKTQVKSILDKAVSFPPEWDRVEQLITGQQQLIISQLPVGSPEFTKVQLKFNLTMPGSQIQRIERIQNRKLWKVFQNELDDVTLKNNNERAQLLDLFHGTSGTPPNCIYESEEGFNIVYSNDGMWGRANYFAVNSQYSNSYAFKVPGLEIRQMFMASVIIGKTAKLNPDRTLKEPPVNAGTGKKFDSVQGNTGGSDVYMVYSNKKAYPSYLITYK